MPVFAAAEALDTRFGCLPPEAVDTAFGAAAFCVLRGILHEGDVVPGSTHCGVDSLGLILLAKRKLRPVISKIGMGVGV